MTWRFESATRHGNEAVTVAVQNDAADPETPEERTYRFDYPLKPGQSAEAFLVAVRGEVRAFLDALNDTLTDTDVSGEYASL